jgi:cell division protein FtsQ
MKDINKTDVQRENSSKRMRRRRRKMNLYGLIVILLVLTVGITVSYTFLFNISEIRVSGESDQYSAEEILDASGINKGDNLLRINTQKSAQNILDNLIYVETAVVERDFPSSLEITVSKCVPAFNVEYNGGFLLVSRSGKILEDNSFVTEGLPIFYGCEPDETTPGKMFTSLVEEKGDAFTDICEKINSSEENNISSVDLSDQYNIIINYSNGIIFKMGNGSDVAYKLDMAETVMNNEKVVGKTGYITMIGSNQCSFRSSDAVESSTQNTTISGEPTTDTTETGTDNESVETTEPVQNGYDDSYSDDSGYSYDDNYSYNYSDDYSDDYNYSDDYDNSVYGEYNDEEEEMFREHDAMYSDDAE